MFDALERAFPVTFHEWREGASYDALIVAGFRDSAGATARTLHLADAPAEPSQVTTHLSSLLDHRLHALDLTAQIAAGEVPPGEVLASDSRGAVWTRDGNADHVRAPVPALDPGEVLRDALLSDRVIGLIAIVELVREVTEPHAHRPPALRATMLFDDPNLRRPTYGYINYPELVRHADEHDYHASMAMIPLDWRGAHREAVALFQRRADRLSLVMHGNDHRKRELFDQHDPMAALAIGAQALRRVMRFEAASGVHVGRVMVPPHGMCSQTMARALGRLPYTALCSIHSFPWTHRPPDDELLAGWSPGSFPEGCAVLSRIQFGSTETDIALRAYMDQPIVLYGHHDDLSGGLDLLAETAARVNRLGDVRWMGPEELALGNVALRRDGDALSVRPFARTIRVDVRSTSVTVEAPCRDLAGWSVGSNTEVHPFGEPAAVGAGSHQIQLRSPGDADPTTVPAPRVAIWPRVRRVAAESRDRLAPMRHPAP